MYYSDYNRPPEDREPIIETDQFHVHDEEPPKPKKKGGFGKIIAVGLCCAIIGGAVGGGGVWAASRLGNTATIYEGSRPSAVSLANVDGKTVLSAEEVYASNLESVVGVNGNVTTNVWGQTVKNAVSGSGFVISSNDTSSYILTNYHVIDGVTDITVFFSDGKSYDATLVGGEEENDIAVLKIEQGGLRPVVLGDSDAINVGENVYAIGNPLGELTYTLTDGIVSALDRLITTTSTNPSTGATETATLNVLQTNCDINPGNSGGPLFDSYGNVVGIVTAKYTQSSSGVSAEGLGFALPINDVKGIITDLIENGYVTGKPNVGVLISAVDESVQRYGVPAGVEIMAILDGSCAQKAGLQEGDIITAVGDTQVTSETQLQSAVKEYKAGDTVAFTIYRDGNTSTVNVTLDEDNQERQDAMDQLSEEYTQQQQSQSQSQQGGNYYYNFPFGGW